MLQGENIFMNNQAWPKKKDQVLSDGGAIAIYAAWKT